LLRNPGDRLMGILTCFGVGTSIAIAILWPNKYSIAIGALAVLFWIFLGISISSSAAC
jgi:hypothetical protein